MAETFKRAAAAPPKDAAESEEEKTERNVFASYCAILLAFLVEDSAADKAVLEQAGVEMGDLATMVREFITFQATTGLLCRRSCDSFERILKALGPV